MTLIPGQILNQRYRIVKLLGQGGFGAVYRAWDLQMEGPCAVKENLDTSQAAQRQFEREAKLLYKLRHPNLPRVFDHFVIEGQGQYLVMDYIEGKDLDAMLASADGPLQQELVLDWIGQVCSALTYLHSQDPPIIHRDIKPANIRIMPDGQAVLVDFGIAKVSDPGTQTTTGARALTPGYAPIEQYGSGRTDARSDIYALGATLYSALTGMRPVESVQRTLTDNLVLPEKINPEITLPLSRAILRAIETKPESRFQSAVDFKQALDRAVEPEPVLISTGGAALQAQSPSLSMPGLTAQENLSSRRLRLGVLGGVAIAAVFLGAVLVTGLLGFLLYNNLNKSDSLSSAGGILPSKISEAQSAESTIATTAGKPPASPQSDSLSATTEIVATSTLFSPALKPDDIPVMPGAEDLQVLKINQQDSQPITEIFFKSSTSDEQIIDFYEREMPANGWTKSNEYQDANQQMLYFTKGKRIATVTISHQNSIPMVAIMIVEQQDQQT